MKNLKKLVSVVLSLAMVISAMTFTASAKSYGDVEKSNKYFEAIDVLSSLKILQGDENGNFNGEAEIKRSEFAAVVCRAMGQENAAKGSASEQRFTDVASNHWAAGYINWAAGQKIVNGKGDGIFDPDAPVKYEEAVKMLVSALGYEPLATRKGGYPTGYMVVAASNGINSGVSLAGSANAPRNIVAQLTYNALDVPLMDSSYVTKNGQDEYNIYDGKDYARRTLLSYYLDIAKLKATVDATAVSDDKLLDKDGTQKVKLTLTNAYKFDWEDVLDGEYEKGDTDNFYVGDTNAADYFGYTVIAYIGENEDGDYEIFAITPDNKSAETLEVTDGFDKVDYATATFEYYENDDDLRTQEVDLAAGFKVYMNGYALTGTDAEDAFNDIKDHASKVVFMGDKGADYDKVFITQYAYGLVDEVIAEDGIIKFKECTSDNELTLDADDRNNSKFTYSITDENGTAIDMKDIEENDVLNILCAYPSSIEAKEINTMDIIVTKGSVEGTVDEEVEKGETYGIDGKEYDIVKGSGVTLEVGDASRYFLTIDGKIFAEDEDYEADATTGKNYGFITKIGAESKFGENYYQIKMFTKDGSLTTFDVADSLYIYENGKKTSALKRSAKAQDKYFNDTDGTFYVLTLDQNDKDDAIANISDRVISYKLNSSGEIKEIKDAATLGFTKDSASYRANSEKFMSKTFTSKSVLFNAPVEASTVDVSGVSKTVYNVDEDDIEVLPFSSLDEDITYNNSFVFDLNSKKEIGLAVITEGVTASKSSALAVVTGISTVRDDMKMVKFFQSGEAKSYVISDNCNDLDDLDVGDVFQYTLTGEEITKGTLVYDYDKVVNGSDPDGDPATKDAISDSASLGDIVATGSGKIEYKMAVVESVENKYVTTDKGDFDYANSNDVGTVALYNTDRAAKSAVTKLSGLSSMKDSSKNVYVVVVRMDDKEVVDAIEYQYDSAVYAKLKKAATSAPTTTPAP